MSAPVLGVSNAAARAALWKLLPGVYRSRDVDGELERFVALFADELWRTRGLIEQQHRDQFIDSCQEWVIPYLGELVGTSVLFKDAALNRLDIKNAIRWRRAKGTLTGLENVARGVSGWGTHAVEMLECVVRFQNLVHLKPGAVLTPDLHDGSAVAAARTPFGRAAALVDLRRADQRAGWHKPTNVALFQWPIASYPLKRVMPAAADGGRFYFHPLGVDTALHAGGDRGAVCAEGAAADICRPNADHVPIRLRDARDHARVYVGTPLGFTLREDGIAMLSGTPAPSSPSVQASVDFAELARVHGMVAADAAVFGATQRFQLEAVRLGALVHVVNGQPAPVSYSPGHPFAAQLVLRSPHGTLALDGGGPSFGYTASNAPYTPDAGEYHNSALLLALTNVGADAAFPESEVVLRSARGTALQVYLPGVAVPAGATVHLYVAADGSTYFARGDHAPGAPDRNPDASIFGALAATHLARASEGQVRLRPGHLAPPQRFRRAVLRSLCCWDKPLVPPLSPGDVAVDPERGRFMFVPSETPLGELSVDFRFGLTGPIGAGPHERDALRPAVLTVARTRNADHASVQAAIDAAPDGGRAPVVIEILDSATYEEALVVANRSFPGGLTLQASALQSPLIRKPAAAAKLLSITNSAIGELAFDGLQWAGGALDLDTSVDSVRITYCTLVPGSTTLRVASPAVDVVVRHSVCGSAHVTAARGTLTVSDSVVQHPAATVEQPAGNAALAFPGAPLTLERATVIGDVAGASAYVSNSLLFGAVALADTNASCIRFSRLPRGFPAARVFRITNATPMFISLSFGDAGYCHLHPNTARALTAGGEDGGEIGAFYSAGIPWRDQNVALRSAEHIPAGLDAIRIRALPQRRWQGKSRL